MNFLFALTFISLLGTSTAAITAITQKTYNISHAIKDISVKFFEKNFSNIAIISSITKDMKMRSDDILTDLIVELGSDFRIAIESKILQDSLYKKNSPLIILINSLESFEQIKDKLEYNHVRFRKYYLLVLVNGLFPGIENVVGEFWLHWIYNINVLSRDLEGNITMRTFFPFAKEKCGNEKSLEVINSFDPETRLWTSDKFFPRKFDNLNLCSFKVMAIGSNAPSVIVKKLESGKVAFSGFEIEIIEEFSKDLNFTAQFIDYGSVRTMYEDGPTSNLISGIFKAAFTKACDIILGSLSLQYDRTLVLTESISFLSVPVVFVIPPAEDLSAFKKLAKPFSALVWGLLLTTFAIGFVFIVFLKTISLKAYTFIVGKNVKYPILNMMIALVGNSQQKLPKLNFARFLLANFLLFCLVTRSAYQGRLYNILQMNLHEKEMTTIRDMIESSMDFYAYESMINRIQGFRFSNRFEPTNHDWRFFIFP